MTATLGKRLERFRDHLASAPLVDTSVHSSFKAPPHLHGYKADFGKAVPPGSRLFDEWVEVTARFIMETYSNHFDALVGIDSGTNDLADRVAASLTRETGRTVMSIRTEKNKKDSTQFNLEKHWGRAVLRTMPVDSALILEDAGSTGSSSGAVVDVLREEGVEDVRVLNTLQRSLVLPELESRGVPYDSLYIEEFKTYTAEECAISGLCAQGIPLSRHRTDVA